MIKYWPLSLTLLLPISSSWAMTPMQRDLLIESQNLKSTKSFKRSLKQRTVKGTIFEEQSTWAGSVQPSWFNFDPETDRFHGVSTNLAYKTFKRDKSQKEVIVAVIDSGVDVNHEDLAGKIWINKNEIPNNNIDDDNNGFVDDIFGWNFIGNSKSMATVDKNHKLIQGNQEGQVSTDSLESTREYKRLINIKNNRELTFEEQKTFEEVKVVYDLGFNNAMEHLSFYKDSLKTMNQTKKALKDYNIEDYSEDFLLQLDIQDPEIDRLVKVLLDLYDRGLDAENINQEIENYRVHTDFYYNLDSNTRADIVKDNYADPYDMNYGNNDVIGTDAFHGTHVAGIIAANRENEIGIEGVAKDVKIMALRAVPNGDERDKDIANSIRYAVDNGAQIINMSFGKSYSPRQKIVFEAIKYAQQNNVLLLHAAGNSNQDNDLIPVFPSKEYQKEVIENWLEIGASSPVADSSFIARFSNFGKNSIDIFAPGLRIRSTVPDNQYNLASGTSMATPVVAGAAAVILSYKNDLDAQRLKDIIIKTSNRYPDLKVRKGEDGLTLLSNIAINAGIPNVYKALKSLKVKKVKAPKKPRKKRIRKFFSRLFKRLKRN